MNNKDIALLLAVATGGILVGYLVGRNKTTRSQQSQEMERVQRVTDKTDPEYQKLKDELLVRVNQYFGPEKMLQIENAYVVVFGVGGVGSNVVNMLVRSGVGRIRIIDFDRVSLSSLSRHAYAVREDVGSSKVLCMKKYINKILPHIQVQAVEEFARQDNVERLVPEEATYVIDCIDNIDAKTALVVSCFRRNKKILVSGGAGMKNDVTRLQIRDISECKNDELLSSLRKKLAKMGIKKGIMVAYSHQEATKDLLPLNAEQQKNPQSFKVFDKYRIRIIPVLGTMPIAVATLIASYVLCDICNESYEPYFLDDVKNTLYLKILNRLVADEKKFGIEADEVALDIDDVYLLLRHIFQWKCFMTGKTQLKQYYLIRWDVEKKASLYNTVVMCKQAYDEHLKYRALKDTPYPKETYERFEGIQANIKKYKDSKHVNYR